MMAKTAGSKGKTTSVAKKVAAKPKRKRAASKTSPPRHERVCNLVP